MAEGASKTPHDEAQRRELMGQPGKPGAGPPTNTEGRVHEIGS